MSPTLEDAEKLFQPLPHVRLGFFPTPFYKLDRLSEKLGVNLYIKMALEKIQVVHAEAVEIIFPHLPMSGTYLYSPFPVLAFIFLPLYH